MLWDGRGERTENDCWARGAGLYLWSPGWSALIVHLPLPSRSTRAPFTRQMPTEVASAVKTTGRPEAAAAEIAYEVPPASASSGGIELKTIVWPSRSFGT